MNHRDTDRNRQRTYVAIDLKSFYASVECNERGLNPLTANLVVADRSRTEKTICLAVSPSLKAIGIPGRASWTRGPTGRNCGATSPSRTSGEWGADTKASSGR